MSPNRPRFPQLPWRSRTAIARDIDVELEFHLEMRVNELIAQGADTGEARRRAREEFGDLDFTRAYCRAIDERADRAERMSDRIDEWRQDVRYAFRTLRRSPGFALVSLITLAVAIGANTAIFSVARAVLLKPLPYGSPESLVAIFESWPGNPGEHTPLSPANFFDYRAQQRPFTDIAAYEGMGSVIWRPESADPVSLSALAVAPNLFNVLATPALHGRTFAPGDKTPGNDLKVVVSYGFWQRALGGDVASIGKTITLNGRPHVVLGVMPRGFTLGLGEDIWMPLDLGDALADATRSRKQHYVHAVGRLKNGTTIASARSAMALIARRLEIQYPEANTGRTTELVPLHESVSGTLRPALLLLQGAALMVLLIACANLANLTLSRTIGRRREVALRAALGAGRGRLVRQLLTESLLLATIGGVIGVALAVVGTRILLALNPDTLPSMFSAGVDGRVVAFSAVLSIATGIVFGLVPALDAARANVHDSLKDGGRAASCGRASERVRRLLVVAQVGLAVMLLVGAGLLVRSFRELTRTRLGFDPDHVLTAGLRAAGARYDSSAAINQYFDAVVDAVRRSPGVVAVGTANILPTRGSIGTSLRVDGDPIDENHLPDLRYVSVRGDYFAALRIPLVAGRLYDASDTPTSPKTVVINETAARRFFPKGDAIGRRIRIGPDPHGTPMTIVGIVGDVRSEGLEIPAEPTMFANHRQETWERSQSIVIRMAGDPLAAIPILRRVAKSADPSLALRDIATMNDVLGTSLAPRRFAVGLATSFSAVALLLALVGIYGVLGYIVTTRTREFGVRLALGATRRSILMLVVRQGLAWSCVGLVAGAGGAMLSGRLLARMLYGVSQVDPSTYVTVVLGLLIVSGIACLIPASRATRVDPLASMRAE
jgi:predicted permease